MRQRTLRCGELDGTQTKSGDGGKRVQIVAGAAFSSGASDTACSPHRPPGLRDCLKRAARAGAERAPRASKRNLVVHVAALAGAGESRFLLAH